MVFCYSALIFATVASAQVLIDTSTPPINSVGNSFLSHGWEMGQMYNYLGDMAEPVFILAASKLSPTIVRVGGISADFYQYIGFSSSTSKAVGAPLSSGSGWWPDSDFNLTIENVRTLTGFLAAANLSILFTLNEMYGRNCSEPVPDCPTCPNEWCDGPWNMSNVEAFLHGVHDDASIFSGVPLMFEVGNELRGHEFAQNTTADVKALASLIQTIWADVPASKRPPLWAPSTDACSDPEQIAIMNNLTGAPGVTGFSFHSYPGGGNNVSSKILNETWLRYGVLAGSDANDCIDAWKVPGGPRDNGLGLWVTETSSSWSTTLPPPAQNSFIEGFFSLANWGAFANAGVGTTMRWSFAEQSPFALFSKNGTRWEVAADYWLYVCMRRALGVGTSAVLPVTGDELTGALVHAYCSSNQNGTVIITAVNVHSYSISFNLNVPTLPRAEWIFTASAGLASFAPVLNGDTASPLQTTDEGDLPSNFISRQIDIGGDAVILLPPLSQSIIELIGADASACK